uniref:Uncharacterized protein n=1 Tax=viral metagenome TaxID=1070528 RepID=A0A6C0KG73_9ZZZZ
MDSKYICEFCQSSFSYEKTLLNHKKLAKYCLAIQGREHILNKCSGCSKTFSTSNWLQTHQQNCVEYQVDFQIKERLKIVEDEKRAVENANKILEKENIDLKQQNDKLQQTIKDLAEKAISKPTITNNNTINNLHIISDEHIKDQVKNLTIDHIKKGALGYSEYFLEYPLKERVICTDYARRKLKYKNEQGEIVSDPEMTNLSDLLFKSIKERNRELTIQYTNELTDKFKIAKDPTQLSYFMEVAGNFSQQDLEVFRMFNGDKNDFFHDILRNICSKTVSSV